MLSWVLYQSEEFPKHVAIVGGHTISFRHFIWWNARIAAR
jgi:hypothetical protein